MHVCVCTCKFVGHCLVTKDFIDKLPVIGGVLVIIGIKVVDNNAIIAVHLTLHLTHPNLEHDTVCSCRHVCVCVCVCVMLITVRLN